jgi:DNA-binding NarL/FixJ family response regulator
MFGFVHFTQETELSSDARVPDMESTSAESRESITEETLTASKELLVGAVRILLVDDQEEVRLAIANLLEAKFDIIGTAENGQDAVDLVPVLSPDVLVLDICMPLLNGIEVAAQLRKSGSASKIVFLTVNEDPEFVDAALSTGALGYVLKGSAGDDLIPAIYQALEGKRFISPSIRC